MGASSGIALAVKLLRPILRTVIDAGDFNGGLFDLIYDDVWSEDQF